MKRDLEKIAAADFMLQQFNVGRWCIEIHEQQRPCLYADDIFWNMMGMPKDLAPEEAFSFWEQQIPEYEKKRTSDYLSRLLTGISCKVEYLWRHPVKGLLCIRCSGMQDTSCTECTRIYGMHQDITEIVHVEHYEKSGIKEVLYEDNRQPGANRQSGGLAVVNFNAQGSWVPEFISDGFASLCGMTPEEMRELYKHDAMADVHPEDRLRLAKELQEFAQTQNECGEFIYRLVRADGSYFWVRNYISSVKRDDGLYSNFCSIRDITAEVQEKRALRQQFRRMFNSYYSCVGKNELLVARCNATKNLLLDADNDRHRDLVTLVGDVYDDFIDFISQFIVDEGERKEFVQAAKAGALQQAFERGERELKHVYFVSSPLEQCGRYGQFKISLLQDPDSKDVMCVLFLTDVTEKTIKKRIIDKMLALGTDRVVDLDLIHERYKLLYAENNHKKLIGREFDFNEHIDKVAQEHVLPADREIWLKLRDKDYILEQLQRKGRYSFSYRVRKRADSDVIKVKKLTLAPVDLRLGRICVVRMDVTDSVAEEVRSKQAIEQALAAAEQANRAKSEFLSNMSHDIRTPMNAVLGMTEIALDNMDSRAEVESCLKKISISGKHLLDLINNVLDMSRIEAGRMSVNRELVSLSQLAEDIVATMQMQAEAKKQSLTVHTEQLACAAVYSDSLRLRQVLLNILGNAVKYTPKGGAIDFTIKESPSAKGPGYVHVAFVVQDNGIGMTDEYVHHIFESFSREDSLRVQKTEGSGLGMAITKYIVDAMGGKISIKSEPNVGTEFTVLLDVERAEQEQAEAQETDAAQPQHALRVLLAEDNALNREIAVALLSKQDVTVETAENGQLCVEKFSAAPNGYYDAVLMDVRMPVMNGYEATKAIRALARADAALPIIAMTADAFAEDVERCLAAGMNAHLSKPMDIHKLMALLERLC
ncbi:PAS domain-containing hybrid sensor histidine kinase/response regulator [uncultured Phascolarctobacterium sp.]|uniref:PAS domain-containing hybrid sensor histidine kinase/response regulator n=1 Tax=uncultured Phascolarctobacterium sp. TaxID=512296 RepID=UPI0025FE6F04|nr:PAS domain-containing hybrid sensor histidine kinase/response regulator [uncultured Phascolarctobacterium sp.]